MQNIRMRKLFYFVIFIIAVLPLFIFPILSNKYHDLYSLPKIVNGGLSLKNYDYKKAKPIPLNGQWEFFGGQHIVSDNIEISEPELVMVPHKKILNNLNRKDPEGYIRASYRLKLYDCPKDVAFLVDIQKQNTYYNIFINGNKVLSREMDLTGQSFSNVIFPKLYDGIAIPEGTIGELVIEITAQSKQGLFNQPILIEESISITNDGWFDSISIAYFAIMLVSVLIYGVIILLGDKSQDSVALLLLNSFMLLCTLFNTRFMWLSLDWMGFKSNEIITGFFIIRILILPSLLLYCAGKMVNISISKKIYYMIWIFEICMILLIWCTIIKGNVVMFQIFGFMGYLPFIYVLILLYRRVKENEPYSLLTTAIILLILSGALARSMSQVGILVMRISWFPCICHLLSMFLQIFTYLIRNLEIRRKAGETQMLRNKLRESEVAMALSQIRPHFVYNVLIAIQVLCIEEPELASETTFQFANYMRENMRFLNTKEPIPFSRELAHIKNYVAIEKTRFQERLQVEFDIRCQDFLIPPLSIQPIVENAIKHGVCKKPNGGTVIIKVYELPLCFMVEVEDNGCGFDTTNLSKASDSVGIANIKFRLKEWMNASLTIESVLDSGTKVLVKIPKEEDE